MLHRKVIKRESHVAFYMNRKKILLMHFLNALGAAKIFRIFPT